MEELDTTGMAGFDGHAPTVIEETAAENEARLRAAGRWDAHLEVKRQRETGGCAVSFPPGTTLEDVKAAFEKPFDCKVPGCDNATYHVHIDVDRPSYGTPEQDKYEKMWKFQQYRAIAPGEDVSHLFLQIAKPPHDAEVIDFGAGTGRGALNLAFFGGLRVKMLDFAANCLDEDVKNATVSQPERLSFLQHDLNRPVPFSADYGFCTDVMEHLPPGEVETVLMNVMRAARHVFFQISCTDDVCGALIGQPLHLSVHPYAWWLKLLQELGAVVHWSKDGGDYCLFYVSAWLDAKDMVQHGEVNAADDFIKANVEKNLEANWPEIQPHPTNDMEVMILGGGPSLAGQLETIKQMRAEGVKLITLNGTYNWALDNGLVPSAQIMVDSREFNARFTKPVVADCKYLISSQCHPSVLEGLPRERTYMWHGSWDLLKPIINAKREQWFQIPGGSTVMLRAIPLLRLLGFKKYHLFGFDSCLADDKHHAYEQPENNSEQIFPVSVGGRQFRCHPWMISQAQEFMDLIKFLGQEIDIEVYGDGLIKHILTTGAELADADDFLQ